MIWVFGPNGKELADLEVELLPLRARDVLTQFSKICKKVSVVVEELNFP